MAKNKRPFELKDITGAIVLIQAKGQIYSFIRKPKVDPTDADAVMVAAAFLVIKHGKHFIVEQPLEKLSKK